MRKLALSSSVVLSLAFIVSSNVALTEPRDRVSTQLLAQSEQEPQSPQEFIDSLELTNEQQEQIQRIFEEYRPEVRRTFEQLQVAAENLRNTIGPSASDDEIRIARQQAIYLERQLQDLLFEELIAIRSELTLEQREQINQRLRELSASRSR